MSRRVQSRAPWLLLVFIAACAAPMQLDAGQQRDAGVAAPVAFCLSSRCDVDGAWQLTYTRDSGSYPQTGCFATGAPLKLTSDGGVVCMPDADDGSSDGGCGFWFHVKRNSLDWAASEVWAFDVTHGDGGALVGWWSVDSVFPRCSDSYAIRATR